MIEEKQNEIINLMDNCDEIKRFKELEIIIKNNDNYNNIVFKFNSNLDNNEIIKLRKELFDLKEIKEYSMLENEIRIFSKRLSDIISSIVEKDKC